MCTMAYEHAYTPHTQIHTAWHTISKQLMSSEKNMKREHNRFNKTTNIEEGARPEKDDFTTGPQGHGVFGCSAKGL